MRDGKSEYPRYFRFNHIIDDILLNAKVDERENNIEYAFASEIRTRKIIETRVLLSRLLLLSVNNHSFGCRFIL